MPKIHNTKKQRALELKKRLENGPAFSSFNNEDFTTEEAARQYKIWVESWVLSEFIDLVPQLKKAKKDGDEGFDYSAENCVRF